MSEMTVILWDKAGWFGNILGLGFRQSPHDEGDGRAECATSSQHIPNYCHERGDVTAIPWNQPDKTRKEEYVDRRGWVNEEAPCPVFTPLHH